MRVLVIAVGAIIVSSALVGITTANDDYPNSCRTAEEASFGEYELDINQPDDWDAMRFPIEEGDKVNVTFTAPVLSGKLRISLGNTEANNVSVGNLVNATYDSSGEVIDTELKGTESSFTLFAKQSGHVCIVFLDGQSKYARTPYAYEFSVVEAPDAPTPTPSSTPSSTPSPTPTATPSPTPTATPSPTPTATTTDVGDSTPSRTDDEMQDSDGDGVGDSEDYAPNDPDVQEASDARTTSSGQAPGFGAGVAVVALSVATLIAVRRL